MLLVCAIRASLATFYTRLARRAHALAIVSRSEASIARAKVIAFLASTLTVGTRIFYLSTFGSTIRIGRARISVRGSRLVDHSESRFTQSHSVMRHGSLLLRIVPPEQWVRSDSHSYTIPD